MRKDVLNERTIRYLHKVLCFPSISFLSCCKTRRIKEIHIRHCRAAAFSFFPSHVLSERSKRHTTAAFFFDSWWQAVQRLPRSKEFRFFPGFYVCTFCRTDTRCVFSADYTCIVKLFPGTITRRLRYYYIY